MTADDRAPTPAKRDLPHLEQAPVPARSAGARLPRVPLALDPDPDFDPDPTSTSTPTCFPLTHPAPCR